MMLAATAEPVAVAPTLRPYQREAVERVAAAVARHHNPIVVLPTGAGKSLVLAEIARRHAHLRPLILAHRRELVEQDAAALERLGVPEPAIVCAGLGRDDTSPEAPIVVGSIQTVARRELPDRGLLIVDEAHLVPPEAGSQYQQVIGRYAGAPVVGLSATPYRLGDGPLVAHPDIPFDEVVIDVPASELVAHGWLAPVVLDDRRRHAVPTTGVRTRGGEFLLGELERSAAVAELVARQMADAAAAAADRRSILIFTVGKAHAALVAAALEARGERVAVVTEDTPAREREGFLAAFRAHSIRWLVNVDVLTTGFDAPGIDAIVCLRPTCSKGLFVQMVGRGFRIAPGKTDCLILDYGGNIDRHEPLEEVPGERRIEGVIRPPKRELAPDRPPRSTWHDRVLRDEIEPVGRCTVLRWYAETAPSRSAPGTRHVLLKAFLRDSHGRERRAWVWYTPEHPSKFARYRALQVAHRLGWPEHAIDAGTLAGLLHRRAPDAVEAWIEATPRGKFWRLTW